MVMPNRIEISEFARELARVAPELVIFGGAGVSRDPPAFAPVFAELRAMLLQAVIDGLPLDDDKKSERCFSVPGRQRALVYPQA